MARRSPLQPLIPIRSAFAVKRRLLQARTALSRVACSRFYSSPSDVHAWRRHHQRSHPTSLSRVHHPVGSVFVHLRPAAAHSSFVLRSVLRPLSPALVRTHHRGPQKKGRCFPTNPAVKRCRSTSECSFGGTPARESLRRNSNKTVSSRIASANDSEKSVKRQSVLTSRFKFQSRRRNQCSKSNI